MLTDTRRESEVNEPTSEDVARDLAADLADCQRVQGIEDHGHRADVLVRIVTRIAPAAIRRAAHAESKAQAYDLLVEVCGAMPEPDAGKREQVELLLDWVSRAKAAQERERTLAARVAELEAALREIAATDTSAPEEALCSMQVFADWRLSQLLLAMAKARAALGAGG